MKFYVIKASGEKELFDIEKFRRSLRKSGADDQVIEKIAQEIIKQPNLRSTKDIYSYAQRFLEDESPVLAARYSLKQALFDLGPAGFPWEKYVGSVFEAFDYEVTLDQMVQGKCIMHEIDVIAKNATKHYIAECKFHNRRRLKTDVQVVLSWRSTFDDVYAVIKDETQHKNVKHIPLVVTNTKFTTQAIKYAECAGIDLIGWGYPHNGNIAKMIDKLGLYPVTALTHLTPHQKKRLVEQGCVMCSEIFKCEYLLHEFGLDQRKVDLLLNEAKLLCKKS